MSFATEIALRKAVRDLLVGDALLLAKLGGPHVYDEAPRNQEPPYIVFARSETRDWSTMTDDGAEHLLTLEVWSQKSGAREALETAGRVGELLHEGALPMSGALCVHAQIASIETLRQSKNRFTRARLRLRALIELQ